MGVLSSADDSNSRGKTKFPSPPGSSNIDLNTPSLHTPPPHISRPNVEACTSLPPDQIVYCSGTTAHFCSFDSLDNVLKSIRVFPPLVPSYGQHSDLVSGSCFASPTKIAFGSRRRSLSSSALSILDLETNDIVEVNSGHESNINEMSEVVINENGGRQLFCSGGDDATIRLWNDDGNLIASKKFDDASIRVLRQQFSMQSSRLYCALGSTGRLIGWHVEMHHVLEMEMPGQQYIFGFSMDEEQETLYCAYYNKSHILVISPREQLKPVNTFPVLRTSSIGKVHFDKSSNSVLILTSRGSIMVYDVRNPSSLVKEFNVQHRHTDPYLADIVPVAAGKFVSVNDSREIATWTLSGKVLGAVTMEMPLFCSVLSSWNWNQRCERHCSSLVEFGDEESERISFLFDAEFVKLLVVVRMVATPNLFGPSCLLGRE